MKFQDQVVASPSKMCTSDYITPKAALLNYGNYGRIAVQTLICFVWFSLAEVTCEEVTGLNPKDEASVAMPRLGRARAPSNGRMTQ